jgi:hypothetical protein
MKIIFAVAIVVLAVIIFYRFFILPRKIDKAIKTLYRHPGEERQQKNLAITTCDNSGQDILLFNKKASISAGG